MTVASVAVAPSEELAHPTSFVSNMQLPVHRWFRYSAGFSAAWVEQVLKQSHCEPGQMTLLDPFAGSGTTLIAAQACGVASVGWDSHPFVSRVAKAKLRWTEDPVALRRRADDLLRSFTPMPPSDDLAPLLLKCYRPDVLGDLRGLRDAVMACERDGSIGALVWLAFVAVVRRVSHVGTAQWQYVLPNKQKRSSVSVREAFADQIGMMATDMSRLQSERITRAPALIVDADARSHVDVTGGWATHVVCSPPYANNYDYADATRLEQTVLGEVSSWGDLKQVRTNLIRACSQHMAGYDSDEALSDPILEPIRDELYRVYTELETVRTKHGGRKAYHSMVVAYFHDLARVWTNLRNACAPRAQVCFVIGDSAPYGVHVPVERWLGELAMSAGFSGWRFEKVRDRNVKWKNRKHQVPLHEGRLWVDG
jgi:hypothetical protein